MTAIKKNRTNDNRFRGREDYGWPSSASILRNLLSPVRSEPRFTVQTSDRDIDFDSYDD